MRATRTYVVGGASLTCEERGIVGWVTLPSGDELPATRLVFAA